MSSDRKLLTLILRIGVFMTFLGHGMFALEVKHEWIPFLTIVGFSSETAISVMPYIGMLDLLVALSILIYPMRGVVIWAVIWAFATAVIRPVSGYAIWDFVERGANWMLPLALLIIMISESKRLTQEKNHLQRPSTSE